MNEQQIEQAPGTVFLLGVIRALCWIKKRFVFVVLVPILLACATYVILLNIESQYQVEAVFVAEDVADGPDLGIKALASGDLGGLLNLKRSSSNSRLAEMLLETKQFKRYSIQRARLAETSEMSGKPEYKLIKKWDKIFKIEQSESGAFRLSLMLRDSTLAQEVLSDALLWLDSAVIGFKATQSKYKLALIDSLLAQRRELLYAAEDSLANFQVRNKIYAAEGQLAAALTRTVEEEEELAKAEINLKVAEAQYGENSSQSAMIRSALQALRNQIESKKESITLAPQKTIQLGIPLARLVRNVRVHAAIYSHLQQQSEQYRLELARRTPVISKVEITGPGGRRAYPRRLAICQMVLLLSSLAISSVLLFKDMLKASEPLTETFRSLVGK